MFVIVVDFAAALVVLMKTGAGSLSTRDFLTSHGCFSVVAVFAVFGVVLVIVVMMLQTNQPMIKRSRKKRSTL